MTKSPPEPALATVHRTDEGVVEIHIDAGVPMTIPGIRALIARVDAQGLTAPERMLVVLPDQEIRFHLSVMRQNHFIDRPKGAGRRMALVVPCAIDRQLAKLYFSTFPSPMTSRVFHVEADARTWLADAEQG